MPLLPIVHWWMASQGKQLVHAGLVGTPQAAALLAGQGGAGKSNTALSCLNSELCYASDDYCLIEAGPSPRGHSLFCTGRLHPPDLDQLAFLKPAVSNPHDLPADKALFFCTSGFPSGWRPTCPCAYPLAAGCQTAPDDVGAGARGGGPSRPDRGHHPLSAGRWPGRCCAALRRR